MTKRRALAAVGLLLWLSAPPLACNGGCGGGGGGGNAGSSGTAGNAGKAGSAGNAGKAGGAGAQAGAGQAGNGGAGEGGAGQGGAGTGGAGMAGEGGAGAGGDGGAGMAGAGQAGMAGAAGNAGAAGMGSLGCGDGVRDPMTEECDDGPSHLPDDACTDTCRVRDFLACPSCGTEPNNERFLSLGRHVLSATNAPGLAVSFPYATDAAHSLIGPATPGTLVPMWDAQPGPFLSNPVVVAIPSAFLTVWTGQGSDGDGLGIRARVGSMAQPAIVTTINSTTLFGQRDPDAVSISDTQFVVAWVDDTDLDTGPDLRVATRTLTSASISGGGDSVLANTVDAEGNVALCAFGTGYAAAWRAGMGAVEAVRVKAGATEWAVDALPPGPADDRPALAAIDATHVIVAYSKGVDTDLDGLPDRSEVRVAVFDTAQPGAALVDISVATADAPYADQPSLAVAGGVPYVGYRIPGTPGDPLGDELYFAELGFAGSTLTVVHTWPLPRELAQRAGDQRRPALTAGAWTSGTVLVAAWEDHAKTVTGSLKRDVLMQITPLPVVRNNPLLAGGN